MEKQIVENRWGAGISQSLEDSWVYTRTYPGYDAVKVKAGFSKHSKVY